MSLEHEIAALTAAVTHLADAISAQTPRVGASLDYVATLPAPKVATSPAATSTAAKVDANTGAKRPVDQASAKAAAPKEVEAKVAPPSVGDTPTLEDCKTALKAVATRLDPSVVRAKSIAVLAKFSAQKLPELKPESYAAFIAACAEVVG